MAAWHMTMAYAYFYYFTLDYAYNTEFLCCDKRHYQNLNKIIYIRVF